MHCKIQQAMLDRMRLGSICRLQILPVRAAWLALVIMISIRMCSITGVQSYLQEGKVSKNLNILLVNAQSILVALDGLIIIAVRPVQEPEWAKAFQISGSDSLRFLIQAWKASHAHDFMTSKRECSTAMHAPRDFTHVVPTSLHVHDGSFTCHYIRGFTCLCG